MRRLSTYRFVNIDWASNKADAAVCAHDVACAETATMFLDDCALTREAKTQIL